MSDPILADSFRLSEPDAEITTLALVSLKTALRAYFSTYSSVKPYWGVLTDSNNFSVQEVDQVYRYSSYYEYYVEAIVRFQHFVELSCLDLLRRQHPILTTSRSNEHIELWKELHNITADWEKMENKDTINSKTALWRLWTLVTKVNFGNGDLNFFDEQQRDNLLKLRDQRDHLLHRGTVILRYASFDMFIGQCVLPFVCNVLTLPFYADRKHLWDHKPMACQYTDGNNVNPLNSIFSIFQSGYDLGAVALFKEMGRAAYQNPLPRSEQLRGFGSSQYKHIQPRAEKHAEAVALEHDAWDLRPCPVCGAKTLLIYGDTETEGDDPMEPEKVWHFTNEAECTCCSFNINRQLKNLREYGIEEDDYWRDID